jgi:hypothetical protein
VTLSRASGHIICDQMLGKRPIFSRVASYADGLRRGKIVIPKDKAAMWLVRDNGLAAVLLNSVLIAAGAVLQSCAAPFAPTKSC